MDSWLGSFISGYRWKWIYNLPRLLQTKSPNQNQRVYSFTCRGGFLCWFKCYSFSVFMRLYKHLPLASTLAVLVNFVRWLFSYTSVVNLCVLVLDRFIAIVHPLKYITFMTRRRMIQVIFFSWTTTAGFAVLQFSLRVSLKTRLVDVIFCWLDVIFLEFLPSTLMVFSFVSIIVRVRKHYGSARTLSKQLRYNHRCVSLKTYHGEKSAVIMMGIVIGVFVITYGMYLHCSFLILFDTTGMVSCNDVKYKFPVLVLNSAINPLAYAFFKRDVKKEFRRLISIDMFFKGNQVKPSTYVLDTRRHLSSSLV